MKNVVSGLLSFLAFAIVGNQVDAQVSQVSMEEIGAGSKSVLALSVNKPTASTQYLHILSTGQSLGAGNLATPTLSTSQPYGNLSLSNGLGGYAAPLIPLVEDVGGESPSSGLANTLHVLDTAGSPIVVGLHAVSGQPYANLKKGSNIWTIAMAQVTTTKSEVEAMSGAPTYVPLGVTVVHGESDYFNNNTQFYQGYLEEWQRDYEQDISAIVGSPVNFPMFVSQMNAGWSSEMALAQYQTHKDNPGKIMLIGPKYQYVCQNDHLHLQNIESKHLGEMMAKVMNEVALRGRPWNPLMPSSVVLIDSVITIDYHIPVGTLALDTVTVARRPNYGFEFVQTGGNAVTITDVSLVSSNTKVQITLSAVPTGTSPMVRYGCTCYNGIIAWCNNGADSSSVGGNLRDTDNMASTAIGSTGLPLYDWGVTFAEPAFVPVSVQNANASSLKIFPNPAHDQFKIDFSANSPAILSVMLYDLRGQKVKEWQGDAPDPNKAYPLGDVIPGLHLLVVNREGLQPTFSKMIVR